MTRNQFNRQHRFVGNRSSFQQCVQIKHRCARGFGPRRANRRQEVPIAVGSGRPIEADNRNVVGNAKVVQATVGKHVVSGLVIPAGNGCGTVCRLAPQQAGHKRVVALRAAVTTGFFHLHARLRGDLQEGVPAAYRRNGTRQAIQIEEASVSPLLQMLRQQTRPFRIVDEDGRDIQQGIGNGDNEETGFGQASCEGIVLRHVDDEAVNSAVRQFRKKSPSSPP